MDSEQGILVLIGECGSKTLDLILVRDVCTQSTVSVFL